MKKTLLVICWIALFAALPVVAQNVVRCASQPPCAEFEDWLQPLIDARMADPEIHPNAIYTIPTVMHVIHNGENVGSGTNLSVAQLNSQFDVLNEDFRKTNADFNTVVPAAFQSVAADCEINFCKAMRTPQGNAMPTPGVNRINRNTMGWTAPPYSTSYIDNTIKPATIWDPTKYFNVWVVNISGGILGYATFPVGSGLTTCMNVTLETATRTGVVILYNATGRVGNLMATYNKGRTATHEVGHWLGLRHIWGDANCGNDCCNDTPTQASSNFNCPTFPKISCNNGPNGEMYCNYMDYVPDACMAMFTQNQKARMQTCMANGTYRAPLNTSNACTPVGIDDPYFANAFTLFPNPTTGTLNIRAAFPENNLQVRVYNSLGEKVADLGRVVDKEFSIDLSSQPNGIYMVEFNNGNIVQTMRANLQR
jgi:hypothetical protein